MADTSHSMDKPVPQSASQWVPPFTHTSSLPSARTLPANAAVLFSYETDFRFIQTGLFAGREGAVFFGPFCLNATKRQRLARGRMTVMLCK